MQKDIKMHLYFMHILLFCIKSKSSQCIMQIILVNHDTFLLLLFCTVLTEENLAELMVIISRDNVFISLIY